MAKTSSKTKSGRNGKSSLPLRSCAKRTPAVAANELAVTHRLRETDDLKGTVHLLFAQAREEYFEDGMESEFSRGLTHLILERGGRVLRVADQLESSGLITEGVISEALRWIGLMDDAATHEDRRRFLQRHLSSRSVQVRDGALLGISFMDDPRSLPSMRKAVECEKVDELKKDLQQVMDQLEETRRCRSSSGR